MSEPDVAALMGSAARGPWLRVSERRRGPVFDRRAIESLLPHRDPFVFVDRITVVDHDRRLIVCQYDLREGALSGHFPERPIWPGVLQVEAVGQAGLCLARLLGGPVDDSRGRVIVLTEILSARFIRPVVPGEVEIVTQVAADGLFTVIVGQCLQHDAVCSVAAMRGIHKEAGA
jgi:3-hydroxyacyl-[acyl-carrier-protein] dehydratase